MTKSNTCHDAFEAGCNERAKHPLREGQYKLEEARREIDRWHKLVWTIATRIRAGGKFGPNEHLGPCMAEERGAYLKSIPVRLAELLGYKVLPGSAALKGDGVPKAEVQRLLALSKADAERLIAECEAVRIRLKGGIDREYRAMRQGESALIGLLEAAKDMVDRLVAVASVSMQRARATTGWF